MLNKINFTFKEADEQTNLFTMNHTKYVCTIEYNNKQYTFDYQCNPKYSNPNLKDCLDCLMLDGFGFDGAMDIFDFANEFGYDAHEDAKELKRVYKACERTSKALHRLFTNEELSELEDEVRE